jgi:hypothetical protein
MQRSAKAHKPLSSRRQALSLSALIMQVLVLRRTVAAPKKLRRKHV